MSARLTMTIGGEPVDTADSLDVIDPAFGTVFAAAPDAGREHLDQAVVAARAAFASWRMTSFDERRSAIGRFAAALRDEIEPIAELLTREQGKPLASSRRELTATADRLEALAGIESHGGIVREDPAGAVRIDYVPMGVVGIIAPWNAPVLLAMQLVGQALAAGNAVVVKPSPLTPLATLAVGAIAGRTLPPGLVNTLSGGNALGEWMTAHPGIDKIGFVGSTATGKRVMASAAGTLKRVSLELGGNDAAIVLDDADVAAIAPKLFWSAFMNSGQICMAAKRIYVHASRHDELVAALADEAKRVRVGNGLDAGIELGPVQNRDQFEKVLAILADARASGATIAAGGAAIVGPGYFIAPTIVTNIAEGARLVDEEQFGPVLPILRFVDDDEAVARANATRFGLGASVWGCDLARARRVADRLEAGTVWINSHGGASPDLPFGGFKESGIGRGLGQMGIRSYMEARVVHGASA